MIKYSTNSSLPFHSNKNPKTICRLPACHSVATFQLYTKTEILLTSPSMRSPLCDIFIHKKKPHTHTAHTSRAQSFGFRNVLPPHILRIHSNDVDITPVVSINNISPIVRKVFEKRCSRIFENIPSIKCWIMRQTVRHPPDIIGCVSL